MTTLALLVPLLAFWPWHYDAWGLPKVVAGSVVAAVFAFHAARSPWQHSRLYLPVLALGVAFCLSLAFSIDPTVATVGIYTQPFYGLAAILIPLATFAYFRHKDGLRAIERAAVLGLFVETAVCMIEATGWPKWGNISGRVVGTMGNPVFLGAWVAVAVPLAIGAGNLYAVLAGMLCCWLAHSRGCLAAATAGVLAQFLMAHGRSKAVVALVAVSLLAPLAFPARSQSDLMRLETWKIAAQAGAERPLFGWGPESFPLVNRAHKTPESLAVMRDAVTIQPSAHNDVLEAWATLGVLGVLALAWLWLAAFRAAWYSPAAVGSLVALFVQAKIEPVPTAAVMLVAAVVGACEE